MIDVLKAQGNFTTLLAALDQAQLTETLASRSAVTVLAPTDAAFAALPDAERTRLMDPANAQELRNLLLYHVIVADVSEDQIKGAAGPVETAGGVKIQIDGSGDQIKADSAIVSAEVDAGNGGVFPIDKVLNPTQSMAAMGDEEAPAADAAAPATETTPTAPATPAAPAETMTPPAATSTTTPAAPGTTAPNGQPAATTTTTASPPVANPTDGQVDSPATPPVDTPDPSDDDDTAPTPAPTTPQS
ncbi:MAG: fasciclin domain-containing protein [Brevundimonas sp.]|nr:MAG: fasciclin domain-containing protein [Brevundimonas sp.]